MTTVDSVERVPCTYLIEVNEMATEFKLQIDLMNYTRSLT
jgi:hypothetical protein